MVKLTENRGHALTFTPGNRNLGKPKKPILPSVEEVAILRRASLGFIIVTLTETGQIYTYEDGSWVTFRSGDQRKVERQFARMVANGWLVPDRHDTLFDGGPPQIYRARKVPSSIAAG
jgi:hypothetical protein